MAVAEAYTTQPDKETASRVLYLLYFKFGVGRCSYDASTALPPGLEVGGLEV